MNAVSKFSLRPTKPLCSPLPPLLHLCQILECCNVPNRYRYARYLNASTYPKDTDMPDTYASTYPTDTDKRDTYAAAYPTDTDTPDNWMLQRTQQIQMCQIPGCCSVRNRYGYGTYLDAAAYSTDTVQIWHIPGCCSVLNRYRYDTYLDAATH